MDTTAVVIQALGALILGSGGIVGWLNMRRVKRQKAAGGPKDERVARRFMENTSLNKYWQAELDQARKDRRDEMTELREQVRNLQHALQEQTLSDAERIDQLEEWIWLRKSPPPPKRTTRHREDQP